MVQKLEAAMMHQMLQDKRIITLTQRINVTMRLNAALLIPLILISVRAILYSACICILHAFLMFADGILPGSVNLLAQVPHPIASVVNV